MAVEAGRSKRLPSLGGERLREAGVGYAFVLVPLGVFVLLQLYPMAYAFYVSAHEWGGIEGNLGYVGLRQLPRALARRGLLDLAARASDGPLEHGLLRAPRRPPADDARADDGAPRQPGDPRTDFLPVGVLLPGARLLGGGLRDRALPPERGRARERRHQRRYSGGTSSTRGSAMPTRRSSRSSCSTRGRPRGR